MAASLTVSRRQNGNTPVTRYEVAWTSHTDGSVALPIGVVNGVIERVVTNPDNTAAPTDNYDITLTDEDGLDVLANQGQNRDTANSEQFCPGVAFTDGTTVSVRPVAVAGVLTLNITNAGSGKIGTFVLYVR